MRELQVYGIDKNNYLLIDKESKKEYHFDLYFFDLKDKVTVGDSIVFNEKLLDNNYLEYSEEYYFGSIDDIYGREINSLQDIDLIAIKKGDRKIFLKRFYG